MKSIMKWKHNAVKPLRIFHFRASRVAEELLRLAGDPLRHILGLSEDQADGPWSL